MLSQTRNALAAALIGAVSFAAPAAQAGNLIISTGLGHTHLWVGDHMNPFADAIEQATNGEISFTRFYAGELSSIGRELDGLQSGTIQVAAPLLAPYHEGQFPLSDVTQLPTYNTDSPMATRAFQKLLDSDVELKDGKTFYQYEIADKGIRAWALGATAAYSISTTNKVLTEPSHFAGLPVRARSSIHTIVLQQLGATSVTMPAAQAYEALSRGTVEGLILAISDWTTYSFQQLLRHTITDVAIGHWESYLAVSDEVWDSLSDEHKALWDETARRIALENAQVWEAGITSVTENSISEYGGSFVPVTELSEAMQQHIAKAAANTWIAWIEQTEANGHPAKATARLYAELITAEGGSLPEGVAEYLAAE